MILMVNDEMPHADVFTSGEIYYSAIQQAYIDLSTAYHGVNDFIGILDLIFEGFYSLSAVTIAGLLLTAALDGYFIQDNSYQKAKYIRINEADCIYLTESNTFLTNREFHHKSYFDGNNGKKYQLIFKK